MKKNPLVMKPLTEDTWNMGKFSVSFMMIKLCLFLYNHSWLIFDLQFCYNIERIDAYHAVCLYRPHP